jgi:uncharacterized protein (DUF2384 family)
MSALTERLASELDREAAVRPMAEVAGWLQEQLGQRMVAHLAGLEHVKQIGRYARDDATPRDEVERRLREGYKVVRMIAGAYDATTAKAWLFGTNSRLDDQAPIDMLRRARSGEEFADVVRAARQFASADE